MNKLSLPKHFPPDQRVVETLGHLSTEYSEYTISQSSDLKNSVQE